MSPRHIPFVTQMTHHFQISEFTCPPIVETVLGVQFAPLPGFKSHHYGWLWREYLSTVQWIPIGDEKLLPRYVEAFDDRQLKISTPSVQPQNAIGVRLKLRSEDRSRTIQIQPDKFYFSWVRDENCRPGYAEVKPEFERLFNQFEKFTVAAKLGPIKHDLWEVLYVNQIPRGPLWSEPSDWYRILPKFFPPSGPSCDGIRFATYQGDWHFEIEPQRGRIHVQVAKMMMNQKPEPVLFLKLTARGSIDDAMNLKTCLDIGHDACVRLFCEITSEEAQQAWRC